MIDLNSVFCAPIEVTTDPTLIVGAEVSCPQNWSGQYVSPSQDYRVARVRWSGVPSAAAASFRLLIGEAHGGATQVIYTPPTDPAGVDLATPRASQQSSIVGRLVGPFRVRQRGFNRYDLEAVLEEDH